MVDASSLSLVRIEIEVACDSGQPCFPFFLIPILACQINISWLLYPRFADEVQPHGFPSHVKIEKAFNVFLFRQNRMPLSLI